MRPTPNVGEIIRFICSYEHSTKEGEVLRILEEVEGLRQRLVLVRSQGLRGSKQWVQPNRILSIISEG